MTKRRNFVLGSAAAAVAASVGFVRFPGSAAEFTFKLANDQPETHPMTIESIAAAKRVREASGGRLEITVFPSSTLGSDPQMLAQARSGAIELLQTGNNIAANVFPAAALESIPFAFTSHAQLMDAANGELGRYIGNGLATAGLHAIPGAFYGGAFQMQNRVGPIDKPEDLKGLKIRVPPGPIDVATFKAFGASPAVISLAEVYTSLQAHIVDAIEVPLPSLENFKFYEQIKFCSLTHHANLVYLLVANADAWTRLPKKLQRIVEREFAFAATKASGGMLSAESTIVGKLRAQGVSFNTPAPEPFRQAISDAGLYPTWRDQYGADAWAVLERAVGKLTA
jgi:tripartite ATP-independent transporter DctP family solute receptor